MTIDLPRKRIATKLRKKGYTLQQIGNVFGLTRQRIDQLLRNNDYAPSLAIIEKRKLIKDARKKLPLFKQMVSILARYQFLVVLENTYQNKLSGNFRKLELT